MVAINDGKVKFKDLNNFDLVYEIKGIKLYTTIVNSNLVKNVRIRIHRIIESSE